MNSLIKKPISHIKRLFIKRKSGICRLLKDVATILEDILNKNRHNKNLIILDDIYPHLLSAFRVAEYNYYLDQFENSEVHSTGAAFSLIREMRSFSEIVGEYEKHYPRFKGKVIEFNRLRKLHCGLIYMIFLNNAFNFIDYIDRIAVSFIFTLYPGGGFSLDQDDSDRKLRRVFSSPNFRKVIVTQKIAYDYIIARKLCPPEKIQLIYGGVLPSLRLKEQLASKKHYKLDKNSLDICFVANKYMEKGIDKGYDIFIEVAKKLHARHKDIYFHVVGPFDGSDIDVRELCDSIIFYGTKRTDFFPAFYSKMDIILSPNVPFVLAPGAFDGFPTGCCIEAGLCGVAVFCTDILNQNIAFKDREEIVIIRENVNEIVDTALQYYNDHHDLYQLAMNGKSAFNKTFDVESQMAPRVEMISGFLNENTKKT